MKPGGTLSGQSDILHAKRSEMDLEIDAPRYRKTQKVRDENRAKRQAEIQERRQEKTQKWRERQQRIREDRRNIQDRQFRKQSKK